MFESLLKSRVSTILNTINAEALKEYTLAAAPSPISIDQIELGSDIANSDCSHRLTLFPGAPGSPAFSPMLPILRTLGPSSTLRVLSALLSERRIIFTACNISKLCSNVHAAHSLLSPATLSWQHIFIPVLPSSLLNYVCAPMPYIIGLLSHQVDSISNLPVGDVLFVDLDSGSLNLSPGASADASTFVPDLLVTSFNPYNEGIVKSNSSDNEGGSGVAEVLYNDLADVLKTDKKLREGGENAGIMGAATIMGGKAKGFMKFVGKAVKADRRLSLGGLSGGDSLAEEDASEGRGTSGLTDQGKADPSAVPSFPSDAEMHYFENEKGELAMRRSLLGFFIYVMGDPRLYISKKASGDMVYDQAMYVERRKSCGDGDGLLSCLGHFSESQMFEQFVAGRISILKGDAADATTREKSDLVRCAETLFFKRQHFFMPEIRDVVKEKINDSAAQAVLGSHSSIVSTVLALTSNTTYKGDYEKALASVVQGCREINGSLQVVMKTLWIRIKDSKGLRWKHSYLSLRIMKALLTDGPLTAIAEVSDGIDKIRELLKYSTITNQGKLVRVLAREVWDLLTDYGRLFVIRASKKYSRREPAARRDEELLKRVRQAFHRNDGFRAVHATAKCNFSSRGPMVVPATFLNVERRNFDSKEEGVARIESNVSSVASVNLLDFDYLDSGGGGEALSEGGTNGPNSNGRPQDAAPHSALAWIEGGATQPKLGPNDFPEGKTTPTALSLIGNEIAARSDPFAVSDAFSPQQQNAMSANHGFDNFTDDQGQWEFEATSPNGFKETADTFPATKRSQAGGFGDSGTPNSVSTVGMGGVVTPLSGIAPQMGFDGVFSNVGHNNVGLANGQRAPVSVVASRSTTISSMSTATLSMGTATGGNAYRPTVQGNAAPPYSISKPFKMKDEDPFKDLCDLNLT